AYQYAAPTPPAAPKKRSSTLLISAAAVALIAVVGTVAAIGLGGGDEPDDPRAGGGSTPSTAASTEPSQAAEHRGPERHRTLDTTKCTDAPEDYDDPEKVQAPDFRYKDILSVKACLQAAGWKLNEKPSDDPRFAEDQVVEQFPPAGSAVDPSGQSFDITVATGDNPEG
ncbi:serine/threonine protein kinase, partial [Streptomyces solincola]